jgi:3-methyl-2-oxobutanoate hydroxymethyltransferase
MKRKSVSNIVALKGQRPIVSLTAYTAPFARVIDEVADFILVGDSLGMVLYNFDSTIPVTLDMMICHGAAVVRSTTKALVIVDMPFGTYQQSPENAFMNAARILKETGCNAVKLEGGREMSDTVSYLTQRGIPVLAHIGLVPQSVNAIGGYRVMGKIKEEGERILDDALSMQEAGAFGVVLECMSEDLSRLITDQLDIPTIGIGASAYCDGQILVTEDMSGMSGPDVPKFVKCFADLQTELKTAVHSYAKEVQNRSFPGKENVYEGGALYSVNSANENEA